MAKILIYKDIIPNGEYDILRMTDYRKFSDTVKVSYHSVCPNVGNRAWLQGIIVALQDGNNNLEFLTAEMTPEFINSEFDVVVLPMANIFYVGYVSAMNRLASVFEKIKIPTYVIACGVQADSFDKLKDLIDAIKEPATKFIRSIYATGGEFALRGYFTKEFFDKLGFHSAVVTGCPSLYQLGDGLKIEKSSNISMKPVLNGKIEIVGRYLKCNPEALYIDQCDYYNLIFGVRDKNRNESDYKYMRKLVQKYGFEIVQYAMERRALLFTDIPIWRKYLIDNDYNFSCGSRIHGNIISILSGIPALIYADDSRTREMAEFFSIPLVIPGSKEYTLEELYERADYNEFNKNFRKNYQQFEEFLISKGLVQHIGNTNTFFEQEFDFTYVDYVHSLLDPYRNSFNKIQTKLYLCDRRTKIATSMKRFAHKMLGY